MPLGRPQPLHGLDDEPVREWARFRSFLRRGRAMPGAVAVWPRWDERRGEPFVWGLRAGCDGDAEEEIPRRFFEPVVRGYARRLLEEGLLRKGDLYRYLITATPERAPGPARAGLGIDIEEEPQPWPFLAVAPQQLIEEPVVTMGEEHADAGDVPVYLPGQVLEEAAELTLRDAAVETGGVLLGHLCRDPESGRAGVVAVAQIAATATKAGEAHLTFTPETWAEVTRARALRGDGSMIVGWWHSHPAAQWCHPDCSAEDRARCPLKHSFFSEMDVNVHRAVFCQGYAVALVLTNTGAGIWHALYGWRAGMVQRRAFQVTGPGALGLPHEPGCGEGAGYSGCCLSNRETEE